QFRHAGRRSAGVVTELERGGRLMDGDVAIQPPGVEQPFVYRGLQMVDEEKLRELRGDELRKVNQNGMLPLMFARLFSMSHVRDLFSRQVVQGKGPMATPAQPEPVEA